MAAIFLGAVRPTFVLNRRESSKVAQEANGDACQAFLSTVGPGRCWSGRCDHRGMSIASEVVRCTYRSMQTRCMFVQEPVFAESPDSLDSVLQFSNAVAASKAQKFRTHAFAMLDMAINSHGRQRA